MSLTEVIVEVIDGKYNLNYNSLSSILLSAEECDNIAVISVIGAKCVGKSFLLNCFLNYSETNERKKWPENHVLDLFAGFKTNLMNKNPVILMYTKPMIISDENKKIAVFFMDTNHVFKDFHISYNKLIEDVIGLISYTSSTVIFMKNFSFTHYSLIEFKQCLSKVTEINKECKQFQEIIFYISDWNQKKESENYNFGKNSGQKYFENKAFGLEIDKYFEKIECYLMPQAANKYENFELKLSKQNNQFKIELSKLLKQKLFDVDEITIKQQPNIGLPIKAKELIALFKDYIVWLNSKTNPHYENSSLSLNMKTMHTSPKMSFTNKNEIFDNYKEIERKCSKEQLDKKSNIPEIPCPSPSFSNSAIRLNDGTREKASFTDNISDTEIERKLNVNHQNLMKICDSELKKGKDIVDKYKTISTEKIFGESKVKTEFSAEFNFGVEQNESLEVPMETDEISNTKCVKTNDDSFKNFENFSEMEVDHQENSENNKNQEKIIEDNFVNTNEYVIINQDINYINEFQDKLVIKYENEMKELFSNEKLTLKQFIDHDNNFKNDCMSNFGEKFYSKEQNYEKYKHSLKLKINGIREELLNQLLHKIKSNNIIAYTKLMKESIGKIGWNMDIMKIHSMNQTIVINTLEDQIDFKNTNNINIKIGIKEAMKIDIIDIRKNFERCVNIIINFQHEVNKCYDKYRHIPNEVLKSKYEDSYEKLIFILNELQDLEFKNIIVTKINYAYEQALKENEEIYEFEKVIPCKVAELVFKKYSDIFKSKLYSGFYDKNTINKMKDNLLKYAIKTMRDKCDFKENQLELRIECETVLKNEVQSYYDSFCHEYQKNSIEAKSIISNAKNNAIQTFISIMNEKITEKSHYNNDEIEKISSEAIHQAIKINEKHLMNPKIVGFNYSFLFEFTKHPLMEKIEIEKEKYRIKNNKNAPKVTTLAIHLGNRNLSAVNFDTKFTVIEDKFHNQTRPNVIAISGDSILYGYEAKNYLQKNLGEENEINKYPFNLKQMLGRSKNSLTNEELNGFPFEFTDNLRVKVNNKKMTGDLSIESLIALQLSEIKSDAENQLKNKITNFVLTVPTNYNEIQKNAIRCAAKIAGLENVEILREITAVAIDYSKNKYFDKNSIYCILILVINDFECDAGICSLKNNQIEYNGFIHKSLNENQDNKSNLIQVIKSVFESKHEDIFKKSFKKLIDDLLKDSNLKCKNINDIILTGDSLLMKNINEWMAEYFSVLSRLPHNPILDITCGSAIFSQMIATNDIKDFSIKEMTIYSIQYNLSYSYCESRIEKICKKNVLLPIVRTIDIKIQHDNQLPLNITIYQDNIAISCFSILKHNIPEYRWQNIKFKLIVKDFCEISLSATLEAKYFYLTWPIELEEIKIETVLSNQQLIEEQNKLKLLEANLQLIQIDNENNIKIKEIKQQLEENYIALKKLIDSNNSLRGLKLKKIKEALERSLIVINDGTDINDFINQIKSLQEMIETYKLDIKLSEK